MQCPKFVLFDNSLCELCEKNLAYFAVEKILTQSAQRKSRKDRKAKRAVLGSNTN
jgi:hypothetical protein